MSTDLDLPVLMSADHVRRREFVAIRRGYDPAQVRDFLEQVADQMDEMERLLREARMEADAAVRAAAQPKVDPYTQLAGRVADVLRAADDEAERARRDAQLEAERILAEARAEADRIRTDAQARAEETRAAAEAALREAREQADRTIAGLSTRRTELVGQLATMQERLVGVARDLEATISVPEAVVTPPVDASAELVGHADDAGPAEDVPPVSADGSAEPREQTIVIRDAPAEDDPDDEAGLALLDPAFGEPWDGTEAISLEVPDIPPLDLDWGDAEDDVSDDDR